MTEMTKMTEMTEYSFTENTHRTLNETREDFEMKQKTHLFFYFLNAHCGKGYFRFYIASLFSYNLNT